MTSTNPRGALNEWAQRHRLQLTFATAFNQGKGCFESSVTVPAIEQPEGGGPPVPGASFRGSGSRKKAAEAAAAEAALAHLAAFDLERPQKVTVADSATAAEALQAACSDKTERELRFLRVEASKHTGGWLPVSAALSTQPVQRWCAEHAADGSSPESCLAALWVSLRDQKLPEPGELEVSHDGQFFRYGSATIKGGAAPAAEEPSGERQLAVCKATLVAVEASQPLVEVGLDTSCFHLDQIAAALGGSSAELIHHGKVSVSTSFEVVQSNGGATPAEVVWGDSFRPSLYTLNPSAAPGGAGCRVNVRASWLAGRPVAGAALLAVCRVNKGQGGMITRDFGVGQCLNSWAALLPELRYARALGAPWLLRLPTAFTLPWRSPLSPWQMLCEAAAGLCFSPPSQNTETRRVDGADVFRCTIRVEDMLGRQASAVCESSSGQSKEMAEGNAALQAVHQLQALAISLLAPSSKELATAEGEEVHGTSAVAPCTSGRQMDGDSDIRLSYTVTAPDTSEVLESSRGVLALQLGSGAVAKQVEDMVMSLRGAGGGGQLTRPPGIHHAGHRLLFPALAAGGLYTEHLPARWGAAGDVLSITVTYVKAKFADNHGGLFSPTLAQQRYHLVGQLLEELRPGTLVDVGCGEGALLEYLLLDKAEDAPPCARSRSRKCPALLCGLDISEPAIRAAEASLKSLPSPDIAVHAGSPSHGQPLRWPAGGTEAATQALLLSADFSAPMFHRADTWGALAGCDVATMIEVIEHLDPEPLAAVPPVVLGALRPKTLVVSTPNIEYNDVLAHVTKRSGKERKLRIADHRFEWTRAEFQEWANAAAGAYGYDVSFADVGHVQVEAEALKEMAACGGNAPVDVGAATQVAIFSLQRP